MYGSLSVSVVKQMLRSYHLPHTQTSANVSKRQHTSAYLLSSPTPARLEPTSPPHARILCPTAAQAPYVSMCRNTSAYVGIRQQRHHTSVYVRPPHTSILYPTAAQAPA